MSFRIVLRAKKKTFFHILWRLSSTVTAEEEKMWKNVQPVKSYWTQ